LLLKLQLFGHAVLPVQREKRRGRRKLYNKEMVPFMLPLVESAIEKVLHIFHQGQATTSITIFLFLFLVLHHLAHDLNPPHGVSLDLMHKAFVAIAFGGILCPLEGLLLFHSALSCNTLQIFINQALSLLRITVDVGWERQPWPGGSIGSLLLHHLRNEIEKNKEGNERNKKKRKVFVNEEPVIKAFKHQ